MVSRCNGCVQWVVQVAGPNLCSVKWPTRRRRRSAAQREKRRPWHQLRITVGHSCRHDAVSISTSTLSFTTSLLEGWFANLFSAVEWCLEWQWIFGTMVRCCSSCRYPWAYDGHISVSVMSWRTGTVSTICCLSQTRVVVEELGGNVLFGKTWSVIYNVNPCAIHLTLDGVSPQQSRCQPLPHSSFLV